MAKKTKKARPKAKKQAAKKKAPSKPKPTQTDIAIMKLKKESSFDKFLKDLEVIQNKKLDPHQTSELKWVLSHRFVELVRMNVKNNKPIPEEVVHKVNQLKMKLWKF